MRYFLPVIVFFFFFNFNFLVHYSSTSNIEIRYGYYYKSYFLEFKNNIFKHPNYKGVGINDIALVQLSSKIYPDDKFISTACIPTKPINNQKDLFNDMEFAYYDYG